VPITQSELDGLNAEWRAGLSGKLTAADKVELAREFGVSLRTVQRWTTTACEQRNPFPQSLVGRDAGSLPPALRDRIELTALSRDGYTNAQQPVTGATTATIRFSSANDALQEMRQWGNTGDPFYDKMIGRARLFQDENGWYISVIYERSY
jgi:hypothetical protein